MQALSGQLLNLISVTRLSAIPATNLVAACTTNLARASYLCQCILITD